MRFSFIVCLLISIFTFSLKAKELKVAVASNFYHSLNKLLQSSDKYADNIKLSSGSSGLLYAQIKNGAPFDVFLSADLTRPQLLQKQGLASQVQTYAIGELVLWPAQKNALTELQQHKGKLVIANPKLAPYGYAAQQILEQIQSENNFKGRLITASNINQAFQFVDTGNAPLAILSKSQLIQAQQTSSSKSKQKYTNFVNFPAALYEPIVQGGVVISTTKRKLEAQQFLDWLLSGPVQQQLKSLGYRTNER